MFDTPRFRALAGVTGAAVAVLLIVPATRWLILFQCQSLFTPPHSIAILLHDLGVRDYPAQAPTPVELAAPAEVAARHESDIVLQIGLASEASDTNSVLASLFKLENRFPNNPTLEAQILRYLTLNRVRLDRPEGDLLSGDKPTPRLFPVAHTTAADLNAFNRIAANGERIDPGNAYFPWMRAIGYFVAGNDYDALQAIRRASVMSRWDDYMADEANGRWRLRIAAFGQHIVLHRAVIQTAILMPQYAEFRVAARVAVYKAVLAEKAGRAQDGLAIRQALLRSASLLRRKSGPLIGTLVGIAIEQIAMTRAGGGPPVKRPQNVSADEWARHRLADYVRFLKRNGQPQEATYAEHEFEASIQARDIEQRGIDLSPIGGRPWFVLARYWVGDMLILGNALWLLAMGLGALLITRMKTQWAGVLLLFVLGLGCLFFLAMNLSEWTEAYAAFETVIKALTSAGGQPPEGMPPTLLKFITAVASTLITLFLSGVVTVFAFVRRRSFAASLAEGMVPAALTLMLVYGGLAIATARQEAQINAGMDSMLQGEGKYLAGLMRRTWPE